MTACMAPPEALNGTQPSSSKMMRAADPFREADVRRAGHVFQQHTDWHLRQPAIPAAGRA